MSIIATWSTAQAVTAREAYRRGFDELRIPDPSEVPDDVPAAIAPWLARSKRGWMVFAAVDTKPTEPALPEDRSFITLDTALWRPWITGDTGILYLPRPRSTAVS